MRGEAAAATRAKTGRRGGGGRAATTPAAGEGSGPPAKATSRRIAWAATPLVDRGESAHGHKRTTALLDRSIDRSIETPLGVLRLSPAARSGERHRGFSSRSGSLRSIAGSIARRAATVGSGGAMDTTFPSSFFGDVVVGAGGFGGGVAGPSSRAEVHDS